MQAIGTIVSLRMKFFVEHHFSRAPTKIAR
jgi:hypothetical protein